MNREKAREVLKQFDEVNGYYSEKFREHEPEVNELKEMQYDYTELSVKLNKTLDEPEIIRENQRSVIDDLMRKSDYKYDEKRLDDPRLTQPYSAQPVQKAWHKSGKGLLFSGLAGLLLGASATSNLVQAGSNYELERTLKLAESAAEKNKEETIGNIYDYTINNHGATRSKYLSDLALNTYREKGLDLAQSALSKIGHREWRENGYNYSTRDPKGYALQGTWKELRDYVSGNLPLYNARSELKDVIAELILRDLKEGKLKRDLFVDIALEDIGDQRYALKCNGVQGWRSCSRE